MKIKTQYVCQECGAVSPKWIGNCPSCNSWNTYVEERMKKPGTVEKFTAFQKGKAKPVFLSEVVPTKELRYKLADEELNQVLGGGMVTGSVVLLGGEPGIGKSTLLLQMALGFDAGTILYVSGEESIEQIKMRADRLMQKGDTCLLLNETRLEEVLVAAIAEQPSVVVIDSIQTIYCRELESAPGTVSQIREVTRQLIEFAKITHTPVCIIGHINKEGNIAGPKVLEHMVDTVLNFEGDKQYPFRILRVLKNRFGHTDEIGIYEMKGNGLIPVTDPSGILIEQTHDRLSGTAVAANVEGVRPMMVETQALVTSAVYGTPQRSVTGIDLRRLHMLLAVLEKRCGLYFGQHDVFLNLAGGLKITDPALDLAVTAALMSSIHDSPLSSNDCFAGEIGLTGEVRRVSRVELRIKEAARLGFERIFISSHHTNIDTHSSSIKILGISTLAELHGRLFI